MRLLGCLDWDPPVQKLRFSMEGIALRGLGMGSCREWRFVCYVTLYATPLRTVLYAIYSGFRD
jgi:hypothetical protein